MDRWAGKVAVVTGATGGIGAVISKDLVKNSVKVVGVARRKEKLQELSDVLGKDKFFPFVCDLTIEDNIVKAFKWVQEKFGGADILIYSAGVCDGSPIIESKLEIYRETMDTNVIAPAICAREFVSSAKKRNIAAHIINMCSLAGHNADVISVPIGMYGASKYALTALAIELRHELSATDIKVTNISPGAVRTDMFKNFIKDPKIYDNIPTLDAHDVSDAVMYALGMPPNVEIHELILSTRDKTNSMRRLMSSMTQNRA